MKWLLFILVPIILLGQDTLMYCPDDSLNEWSYFLVLQDDPNIPFMFEEDVIELERYGYRQKLAFGIDSIGPFLETHTGPELFVHYPDTLSVINDTPDTSYAMFILKIYLENSEGAKTTWK